MEANTVRGKKRKMVWTPQTDRNTEQMDHIQPSGCIWCGNIKARHVRVHSSLLQPLLWTSHSLCAFELSHVKKKNNRPPAVFIFGSQWVDTLSLWTISPCICVGVCLCACAWQNHISCECYFEEAPQRFGSVMEVNRVRPSRCHWVEMKHDNPTSVSHTYTHTHTLFCS